MKRIYLIAIMLTGTFCSIFCKNVIAQAYYNDTVRVHSGQTSVTARDSVLKYLDKTYTNNYIADRIGLNHFLKYHTEGDSFSFLNDTVKSGYYFEDYVAILNSNLQKGNLKGEVLQTKLKSNHINIGVLNYEYYGSDTFAWQDHLITQHRGYIYDSLPRSRKLFFKHKLFEATLLQDSFIQSSYTIKFDTAFYKNNLGVNHYQKIDSLVLTVKNKRYKFLFGDSLVINFETSLKTIKIQLYFSNKIYTSISAIKVYIPVIGLSPISINIGNWNYDTIETSVPSGANAYKANLSIHLAKDVDDKMQKPSSISKALRYLKKPLIFMDGFDGGDERKAREIYDQIINVKDYTLPLSKSRLVERLTEKGYSVIICNWEGDAGAGDMRRNAKNLISILKAHHRVVQDSLNYEKMILICPSMAGQITRYALMKMESDNQPYSVASTIYFDTPHRGANIPTCIQSLLRFPGSESTEGKATYDKSLGSLASKQLLSSFVGKDFQTYLSKPYDSDLERKDFMYDLNQLQTGQFMHPNKTRLINIALGSNQGKTGGQGYYNGELMYEAWAKGGSSGNRTSSGNIGDVFINGVTRVLTRTFKTFDLYMRPDPDNSGDVEVFSYFQLGGAKYQTKIAKQASNSFDNSPGGKLSTVFNAIDDGIKKTLYNSYAVSQNRAIHNEGRFAFIPTMSALDLDWANFTDQLSASISSGQNPNENNLHCKAPRFPFNSYYIESDNKEHVALSSGIIDFTWKEIFHAPFVKFGNELKSFEFYNFANDLAQSGSTPEKPTGFIDEDITIKGLISVNRHKNAGVGNFGMANQNETSLLEVKGKCETKKTTVTIASGGVLVIGDDSNDAFKGIVQIKKYGKILLKTGAKLVINNNSKLVIEDGGILEIEKDAIVELNGTNSSIESQNGGQISLKQDAIFKPISRLSLIPDGYIAFYHQKSDNNGIIPNLIGETNSKLEINGYNKDDIKLKIGGNEGLSIKGVKFSMWHGQVFFDCWDRAKNIYDYQPRINTGDSFRANDILFTGNGYRSYRGVNTYGQGIKISACQFENARTGIYAQNYFIGGNLTMSLNTFKNNRIGIMTIGKGFRIGGTTFINNEYGILTEELNNVSMVSGCRFNKDYFSTKDSNFNTYYVPKYNPSSYNIKMNGNSFSKLTVRNSSLNWASASIHFNGTSTTYLKCNEFSNNRYGILSEYGKGLVMRPMVYKNIKYNYGRNDFKTSNPSSFSQWSPNAFKRSCIYLRNNKKDIFYLANGGNNFLESVTQTTTVYDIYQDLNLSRPFCPNIINNNGNLTMYNVGYYGSHEGNCDFHKLYFGGNYYTSLEPFTLNFERYAKEITGLGNNNYVNCPTDFTVLDPINGGGGSGQGNVNDYQGHRIKKKADPEEEELEVDQEVTNYPHGLIYSNREFFGATNPELTLIGLGTAVHLEDLAERFSFNEFNGDIVYETELPLLKQTLLYNFPSNINNGDSAILKMVFSNYLQTVSAAIDSGVINNFQIDQNGNFQDQYLLGVKEVMDNWISVYGNTASSYEEKYKLTLDYAGLYSMTNHYEKAKQILDVFEQEAHTSDIPYLNQRECIFDKLYLLYNHYFDPSKADSLLAVCEAVEQGEGSNPIGVNGKGERIYEPSAPLKTIDANGNVSAFQSHKISIAPNPTSDMITITFGEVLKGNFEIMVINNLGQVVKNKQILNSKDIVAYQYSMADLPPGIYFLSIKYNEKQERVRVSIVR